MPAPESEPKVGFHTKDGVVTYEEHVSRWKRSKKIPENVERCVELKPLEELTKTEVKHVLVGEAELDVMPTVAAQDIAKPTCLLHRGQLRQSCCCLERGLGVHGQRVRRIAIQRTHQNDVWASRYHQFVILIPFIR